MREAGGPLARNVEHEPHAGTDERPKHATPFGDTDLTDGDRIA
jgi:hypothetical protein